MSVWFPASIADIIVSLFVFALGFVYAMWLAARRKPVSVREAAEHNERLFGIQRAKCKHSFAYISPVDGMARCLECGAEEA